MAAAQSIFSNLSQSSSVVTVFSRCLLSHFSANLKIGMDFETHLVYLSLFFCGPLLQIKSAIHFASSQMADNLFSCFLFGVTFRLLDKVEASNISPLLELFESHIRTTTDRITDIDGKSKHTKVS